MEEGIAKHLSQVAAKKNEQAGTTPIAKHEIY
jgi:hypothetical protein